MANDTTDIRNKVLTSLEHNFTTEQLNMIDLAVAKSLRGYKVEAEETLPIVYTEYHPIEVEEFIIRKKMKGCSEGTIEQYKYVLRDFCTWLRKDIKTVTDIDILAFLDYIFSKGNVSKRTLDHKRLILSSFYTFMHDTGKMNYNPTKTIDRIKFVEKVRKPLNDMELEYVRNACKTIRERAIFETLYSTGGRISEIARINYSDIDFERRSTLILGKGSYERYVYFTPKAIIAIQEYLKTRKDDNPALFVASRKRYTRLTKASIRAIVRELGERAGIDRNVFPHLLRHTFATDMLNHGAKINEVSKLMGHHKLETTKLYISNGMQDISNIHKTHMF